MCDCFLLPCHVGSHIGLWKIYLHFRKGCVEGGGGAEGGCEEPIAIYMSITIGADVVKIAPT